MTKQQKQTAAAVALALLAWWLWPREVVTASIDYEGLAEDQ